MLKPYDVFKNLNDTLIKIAKLIHKHCNYFEKFNAINLVLKIQ